MTPDPAHSGGSGKTSARKRRWLIPPVLAGVMVAAAVVIPQAASASGKPSLRAITPSALVAKVLSTKVSTLSGTLSVSANLGLPDLSSLTGGSGLNPLTFLSGTHTAQLWYDGPAKVRVAMPVGTGEDDFIMNGNTIYLWQSGPYTVTKIAVPSLPSGSNSAPPVSPTPAQIAAELLSYIGPSTAVTVSTTAYVADRSAYELVLAPRTDKSLIGQIVIAVDASTGLPLRVQVIPRGKTAAAFTFGFTQISYAAPAASNFNFTPPKGAKVTTVNPLIALGGLAGIGPLLGFNAITEQLPKGSVTYTAPGGSEAYSSTLTLSPPVSGAPATCSGCWVAYAPLSGDTSTEAPSLVGSGWTSVAVIPTGLLGALDQIGPAGKTKAATEARSVVSSFIDSGTVVSGSWGKGHLVHTALLNVLAVTDGPILVGAVTPATLEAAAAHAG